jgi:hypothetical protein
MAFSPARSVLARRSVTSSLLERLLASAWVDAALISMAVLLAGTVRWPHLMLSPQFPSVGETVLLALDVAAGRAFYLADSAPYLGAPFLWLLALVYRVFGASIETTQVFVWTLGALTMVPTYLLGRELGGRGAGIVAALFLATSGAHTVITSHVALSHSLTPLVTTTTLWLVARATHRAGGAGAVPSGRLAPVEANGTAGRLAQGGKLLALAGLLSGLALQTHPTSAPLLVGAALGAVLRRRDWLRTRWPVVAVALVLVGYSSLLVYHVTSRFEIIEDVESKQARYLDADVDAGEASERGVYVNNLEQLGLATARMVSGALEDRATTGSYLRDPWVLAPMVLALAGLAVAVRRRQWWMVGGVLLAVLLPPAFSGKYSPVLDGRYLMPLLPVLFVAMGLAVATAARLLATLPFGGEGRPSVPALLGRSAALVVLALGTAVLTAHPLTLLDTFYEDSQEDGFSNALYLRTVSQLEAARQGEEPVLLDPLLSTVKSTGGGKASTSFLFLLALADVPNQTLPAVVPNEQRDVAGLEPDLVGKLAVLHRSTADSLDDTLHLEPLDGKRQSGKDSPSYRAYRIGAFDAGSPPPARSKR